MSTQPPPQLSPDGKFYWDGTTWQPMPGSAPAPAQAPQKTHVVTHAAGWRYWFWGILVGGILLFIIWSAASHH